MSTTDKYRFILRAGMRFQFLSLNEVLLDREIGYELDFGLFKIGDGVTPWLDLKYQSSGRVNGLDSILDGQVLAWDAALQVWTPVTSNALSDANVFTNVQTVAPYSADISGAVSIDLAATAKSNTLVLTATADVTSLAFTAPVDGAIYNIYLVEDSTGGWAWPALPSNFDFGAAGAPVLTPTANKSNQISVQWIAALGVFRGAGNAG